MNTEIKANETEGMGAASELSAGLERILIRSDDMTFDEWFQSKQGEAYDSMYVFARDAWNAAIEAEREACAKVCDRHANSTWNDDRKAQARLDATEIRERANQVIDLPCKVQRHDLQTDQKSGSPT